eukprot:205100-Rhodomonas_salina.1
MSEGSPLLLPAAGAMRRQHSMLVLALMACCVVGVVHLGLKQVGGQRTVLLGGDDWLGAPLAVPEDVRDQGEQQIGEEVTYWNTHSGQIGTGGGATTGYPYARARRGQLLLMPQQAPMQVLRLSADAANAQVSIPSWSGIAVQPQDNWKLVPETHACQIDTA